MLPRIISQPTVRAFALLFCMAAVVSRVWIAEDAYITFRVVENLFAGHGAVLNPGDRIEAFTHPLWFLCLALLKGVGVELHLGALLLGLALILTGLVAILWRSTKNGLLVAGPALCALSGFRDFATAGMEFSLVFLLLVILDRLLDGSPLRKRPAAIATVLALLYLTRPELALGAVVYSAFIAADLLRDGSHYGSRRERLLTALRWGTPFVLLAGGWHVFRWLYYADIFPNTYYAKSGADAYTTQGLKYLGHTLLYGPSMWPVLAVIFLFVFSHKARAHPAPKQWAAAIRDLAFPLILVAYWVRAGGDFMSFRFLLPPLVIFALIAQRFVASLPDATNDPARGTSGPGGFRWAVYGPAVLLVVFIGLSGIPAPFARGYIADERQVFTRGIPGGIVAAALSTSAQPWARRGTAFRELRSCLRLSELRITNSQAAAGCLRGVGLGYFGVAAGPGVAILDEQGLPNRSVALQPVIQRFRPGHEHFVTLENALQYRAAFCSSGEPAYDRAMATEAGIVITLEPEIILTLPKIEQRLSELRRLKVAGSNFIPRMERQYGRTIEELQALAAKHRTDSLLRSMEACWTDFPGGPATYFY